MSQQAESNIRCFAAVLIVLGVLIATAQADNPMSLWLTTELMMEPWMFGGAMIAAAIIMIFIVRRK